MRYLSGLEETIVGATRVKGQNNFPLVRTITYPGLNCRYFGANLKGAEIQKTRLVPKLLKVNCKATTAVAEVNVIDLSMIFITM